MCLTWVVKNYIFRKAYFVFEEVYFGRVYFVFGTGARTGWDWQDRVDWRSCLSGPAVCPLLPAASHTRTCLLAFLPLSPACLFVTIPVVSILLATCQPVTVRNSPPRQLDKTAGQASAHQAWDLDCGLASQGQIAALAWTTGLCPLGLWRGHPVPTAPSDHVLPTPREPTCGEALCPDYASLHPQWCS